MGKKNFLKKYSEQNDIWNDHSQQSTWKMEWIVGLNVICFIALWLGKLKLINTYNELTNDENIVQKDMPTFQSTTKPAEWEENDTQILFVFQFRLKPPNVSIWNCNFSKFFCAGLALVRFSFSSNWWSNTKLTTRLAWTRTLIEMEQKQQLVVSRVPIVW